MRGAGSIWKKWQEFVAEAAHTRRASRSFRQGKKLYCADRFEESIGSLQEALAAIGLPSEESPLFGVQFTICLQAVTMLAYAAARTGDRQLADLSIRDGLVRLAEARLMAAGEVRGDEFLMWWERWARSYVAGE